MIYIMDEIEAILQIQTKKKNIKKRNEEKRRRKIL